MMEVTWRQQQHWGQRCVCCAHHLQRLRKRLQERLQERLQKRLQERLQEHLQKRLQKRPQKRLQKLQKRCPGAMFVVTTSPAPRPPPSD